MTEDNTHKELMKDPRYAVQLHEHQLIKITEYLEETVTRLVSLEKKVLEHELEFTHHPVGPDPNDALRAYPEVK